MHGYGWAFSSVTIITQSDTINTKYVTGRLKKKLGSATFWVR